MSADRISQDPFFRLPSIYLSPSYAPALADMPYRTPHKMVDHPITPPLLPFADEVTCPKCGGKARRASKLCRGVTQRTFWGRKQVICAETREHFHIHCIGKPTGYKDFDACGWESLLRTAE